jgi:predicted deacylase
MGLNARGFCVEFSRQHGLKESEYELGKTGIRNIMKAMGMMNGDVVHQRPVWAVLQEEIHHFKASSSGHIRYFFNEYEPVRKGDRLYLIRNIQTLEIVEEVFSPFDGIFCGKSFQPLAVPERTTCWIAPARQIAKGQTPLPDYAAAKDEFKTICGKY